MKINTVDTFNKPVPVTELELNNVYHRTDSADQSFYYRIQIGDKYCIVDLETGMGYSVNDFPNHAAKFKKVDVEVNILKMP